MIHNFYYGITEIKKSSQNSTITSTVAAASQNIRIYNVDALWSIVSCSQNLILIVVTLNIWHKDYIIYDGTTYDIILNMK